MDFDGKRVYVSAGASGIGLATALKFAEHGARVVVSDINRDAMARSTAKHGVEGVVVDVAREPDVITARRVVEERLGGLDILINNAGIAGPTAAVQDIATADFERCVQVNLTGMFLHAKYFVDLLRASAPDSSMVNMSSVAGLRGAPQRTPYCATKWGVVGLTKALAGELGPEGIRVNAICPGIVAGDRIEGVMERKAAALGRPREEVRREYIGQAVLGRMPTAEDVANLIAFVTSDLGRNIHGQALSVDGMIDKII